MNPYKQTEPCALPTAQALRAKVAAGESAEARERISMLFDKDTFVETGAFTKRGFSDFLASEGSNELEGVITGYGAVDGKLVFAFAEDAERMGGMIDERHAKKIADLVSLAVKNGAPILGIFNANGTDIFAGTEGLAAYGRILAAVNSASGKVPTVALIAGKCIGLSCAIASLFDFIVKDKDATFYLSSPALTKANDSSDNVLAFTGDTASACGYIRALISFLPMNAKIGTIVAPCTDKLDRMLGDVDFGGDAHNAIALVADHNIFCEVASGFAPAAVTGFSTVAGVKCGFVGTSFSANEGRISSAMARKISKFVSFCDAYAIPVVTLVDSYGPEVSKENDLSFFAPELAKLGAAYASAKCPKITVLLGHAIGASFVLLGSKALGADLVYAVDSSEIGVLPADAGVAFAWDKYITLDKKREDLLDEWKASVSSPEYAAASGEIDDIISIREIRARIASALLMLCCKGVELDGSRRVLPL